MKLRLLSLGIALASALPVTADIYSARNYAMGGAGVASSEYDAAAGSNGALLTRFDESDDVALILPAIGIEASDKDDVIDTLDDIPDIYDELEANIDNGNTASAGANARNIIDRLTDISGSPVQANAAALIGFAIPSKTFAVAFDVRTSIEAGAIAEYDENDGLILAAAILSGNSALLDDTRSFGLALGAAVTEAALTFATEFEMGEKNALSVSLTPKYQRVDTLLYAVTANEFDSNDFDDNTNDDANFNIDVGLAYSLGDHWVFGLSGRNLISEDYDTEVVLLDDRFFQGTYQIDTTAVAGVAFNAGPFTATVDADLIKNKSFDYSIIRAGDARVNGSLDETQFVRAGVEFNAFSWMQLRAGYRYDIEDTRENVVTAGFGFSPFDVFHFDISGAYGDNDTYGVALDLRWTI